MPKTVIEELEEWKYGAKGRWVEIHIGNGYGADCWNVILGNVTVPWKKEWMKPGQGGSAVYCTECAFCEEEVHPPNVVFGQQSKDESCFVGLDRTIKVALDKAKELGL